MEKCRRMNRKSMTRASSFFVGFCLVIMVLQLADGQESKLCPPWCVTKLDASDERIKVSMDWLCANGADCIPISPGGPCYVENDFKAVASYAFNDYFQKTRPSGGLCDYGEVATLSTTDPSHGACNFTCTPYE